MVPEVYVSVSPPLAILGVKSLAFFAAVSIEEAIVLWLF